MAFYFYPSGQNVASMPSIQGIPSMKTPNTSNKSDMSTIIQPKGDRGGLYIGNISCSQNPMLLKMYKIGAVVTIDSENTSIRFDQNVIKEHFIMPVVETTPSNAILKYLPPTLDFISRAIRQTNVLIHCHSGMRLCSAVATGYIMKANNIPVEKAYSHVKQCRSVTQIDKELLKKLKEYQQESRSPNEHNLPKIRQAVESTFTTDSDESDPCPPYDPRSKMSPNLPLNPPKIQLTESYEGYF